MSPSLKLRTGAAARLRNVWCAPLRSLCDPVVPLIYSGFHAAVPWLQPPSSAVTVASGPSRSAIGDRRTRSVCPGLNGMSSASRTLGCWTPRTNAVAKASGSVILVAVVLHRWASCSAGDHRCSSVLFSGSSCAGSSRWVTRLLFASSVTQPSWRMWAWPPAASIAAMMRRASGDAWSVMASQGREARCSSMYLAAASMLMSGSPARLRSKSAKLGAVHLEWARFPVAVDSLLRLGGFFAPPFRVVEHLAPWRLSLSLVSRGTSGASTTRVSISRLSRAPIWELCHHSVTASGSCASDFSSVAASSISSDHTIYLLISSDHEIRAIRAENVVRTR